jgi:probable F420-dependent oxidoreductase
LPALPAEITDDPSLSAIDPGIDSEFVWRSGILWYPSAASLRDARRWRETKERFFDPATSLKFKHDCPARPTPQAWSKAHEWRIIVGSGQQEETNMLKSGVSMFFTDYSMAPGELGQALEQRGFESLWAPEHSHIPLSRKSPFPSGGEVPKRYYDAMDPFVTLTAAAAATKTLMVGTGVCLVPQRDPIQTAKLVASIDQVSGGRFLFGIGNGWNQDELEDHGVKFADRHKVARERVEAMKEIWTKSKPEYHGEFVNFDPMMAWPKPVQKPHPPIHVGGAFPHGARRAIRYGDGWIPTARGDLTVEIPEFQKMARDGGRDPASLQITSFGLAEDVDRLKRLKDLGVARVVPMFPPEKSDKVMPIIERWTKLMQQVNG